MCVGGRERDRGGRLSCRVVYERLAGEAKTRYNQLYRTAGVPDALL